MSGINLLFDVCVVTFFGLLVVFAITRANAFFAAYYDRHFSHSVDDDEKESRTDYWIYISAAVFLPFIAPILAPISTFFGSSNMFMGSARLPFSLEAAHSIATFQVSFGVLLILMLWKRAATFDEKERFWRSGAKLGMAVSAFAALVGVSSAVSIRADAGYEIHPLAIAGLPDDTCAADKPLAFWVGSSHTIARCPGLWDEFVVPTVSITRFEYSPAPSSCYIGRGMLLKCVIAGGIEEAAHYNAPVMTPSEPAISADSRSSH